MWQCSVAAEPPDCEATVLCWPLTAEGAPRSFTAGSGPSSKTRAGKVRIPQSRPRRAVPPPSAVTCSSENLAMKLRFLLMSIWVGECSSSSLSFCSWPDGTHRNPKEREWGRGSPQTAGFPALQHPPRPRHSARPPPRGATGDSELRAPRGLTWRAQGPWGGGGARALAAGLTLAVAVLLHGPHGALVVAPRHLLPNHLQLPEAPVGEVRPAHLEGRRWTKGRDGKAPAWSPPPRVCPLGLRAESRGLPTPPAVSGVTHSIDVRRTPCRGRCGPAESGARVPGARVQAESRGQRGYLEDRRGVEVHEAHLRQDGLPDVRVRVSVHDVLPRMLAVSSLSCPRAPPARTQRPATDHGHRAGRGRGVRLQGGWAEPP